MIEKKTQIESKFIKVQQSINALAVTFEEIFPDKDIIDMLQTISAEVEKLRYQFHQRVK